MTNFWKALEQVDMSQPQEEKEYRLYYDAKSGTPLFYTSEAETGTYIVVDKKTYNIGNYHCIVENGKVKNLTTSSAYKKLVPGKSGQTTHITNVMIIDKKGTHWKLKNYED